MKKMIRYKVFLGICFTLFSLYGLDAQNKYVKIGFASFYADKFEGRQTANGEIYYHSKKTAAHRTLPFGSIVKVTNLENNKYVVVRINDRGPYVDNRLIDLSKSAAKELGFIQKGLTKVKVELIASTKDLPDDRQDTRKDVTSTNYYKIHTQKVYPKGSGVQIASFKNNDNVFRLIDELHNKYNEEVFVECSKVRKQQVYRIIIGNYSSEEKLEALKKVLSVDYPGCFIVKYKN